MAKFKGQDDIKEEAIPAAIKVKEEILDVRTRTIGAISDYVYMVKHKQKADKELSKLHGNIATLYQLLREKFKDKDTVTLVIKGKKVQKKFRETMDELITDDEKKMNITGLYNSFCVLNKKIEDMKITKIEREVLADGKKLA